MTEAEKIDFEIRVKKMRKKSQRDPNSNRSIKRDARGFESLEKSSRKHRRALERQRVDRTVGNNHIGSGGTVYKPGETIDPPLQGKLKTFAAHAGGSFNYH